MTLIHDTSKLFVSQLLIVTRNCSISNHSANKGTIVKCIAISPCDADEFDIEFSNKPHYSTGASTRYCDNNPRFRIAYKNEEKLWRY